MTRVATLVGFALLAGTTPAMAQERHVSITPHIDAGQVLTADLTNDEVLTYTTVNAGVNATIQTKRVQVQIDYNYSHRFAYDKQLDDADVHSGVVRAAAVIAPGFSIEGGAMATRAHSDIRGDAPGSLAGNPRNTSSVYSVYAGPSFSNRFGPLSVNAGYRFGYNKVTTPSDTGVGPGQRRLDYYDSSTSHLATASVGAKAGDLLPVGITLSGAWQQENAKQLDQRYTGKYARADAVLPVSRTVALTAGVGYENIKSTQRDPLLDGGGNPVLDANGRYVTDPASPRRTAYSTDGVYWDAGLIWRPSMRFEFEARVGKRYNTVSYTGSLSWQTSSSSGLQVGVYDSVDSFGRQMTSRLAALPAAPYLNGDDPFGDTYNGCVFAGSGSSAGGCFNGVFQSISTASYRSRGVDAIWSAARGPARFGIGAGYANRRYYAPNTSAGFSLDGVIDQSYYAQMFASRAIGRNAGVSADVYANYYQSGLPGSGDVWGLGANGSVYRRFGRLNANLSGGVYSYDGSQTDDNVSLQAMFAVGYQF